MRVKRSITVNLSEEELKEIVVEHLKKEGFEATVDDVTFSVSKVCVGYGPMEHEVTKFGGCIVRCDR